MKKYPEEVKKFIADNVQGTTTKDLVALVNAEFGPLFTESKMKAYKSNHKLKSGTPKGFPVGYQSDKYPNEVRKFILDNHKGIGSKDMAGLLNQTFGINYKHSQLKGYYANHRLNSGLKGYFPKGHVPANKGKKGISYEGMEATQFKKRA